MINFVAGRNAFKNGHLQVVIRPPRWPIYCRLIEAVGEE